jgi:3-isopropylmalate/(R)-2-methylmalate dehydratase small subunit
MADADWVKRGRCHRFGHDVPHAGGIVPLQFITAREIRPEVLIPQLFAELRPGFAESCKPGDLVVTGRRFGMGPKVPGYIAMQALGLGLICESMPVQAYRAAINEGLAVLSPCPDVLDCCEDGDELEVDFATGLFVNHTRNTRTAFAPLPADLRAVVQYGGTGGWLEHWWQHEGQAAASST